MSTAARDPLGPRRLTFAGMSDDDFEEFVYLVVLIEFPEAIRLHAPEGGADSVLKAGEKYVRCWQAKRYVSNIHWAKCKASLDAAVERYGMSHYTFCFARDLTGPQLEKFDEHLVGRHKGVEVDHWSANKLTSFLLGTPYGKAVESRFWGNPEADASAVMVAVRAGGALETGTDALERLRAMAEFFENHDPYYEYVSTTGPASRTPAPMTGAVMSVALTEDGKTVRVDALARTRATLERLPRGTFSVTGPEDVERFRRTVALGGEETFRVSDLEMTDLPAAFAGMGLGGEAEIKVKAERRKPVPWDATVTVETDRGSASVDLDLRPTEPPEGWEGALSARAPGGLGLTFALRWRDRLGGQSQMSWAFRLGEGTLTEQVRALAFIEAMHGAGTVTVRDRDGGHRVVTHHTRERPVPDLARIGKRLVDDLLVIEQQSGIPITIPDEIDRETMDRIAEAAYVIRTGQSRMTFTEVVADISPEQYEQWSKEPGAEVGLSLGFQLNLFGVLHDLGYLSGSTRGRIASGEPIPDDPEGRIKTSIVPADEDAAHPVFKLTKAQLA